MARMTLSLPLLLLTTTATAAPVSLAVEDGAVPPPIEVSGVAWVDGGSAWLLVRGEATWLRETTDGGKKWSQVALERGTQRPLGALAADPVFTGAKTGIVAAGSKTWVTTNGGKSWKDAFPAYAVAGQADGTTWAAVPVDTTHWQSRVSDDGGRTWVDCGTRVDGSKGWPKVAELNPGGTGWLVTGAPDGAAQIWSTPDGGCNWLSVGPAPVGAWRGVGGLDSKHLWLIGGRGDVQVTADGGATWAPVQAPVASALRFTSATEGWLIAPEGRLHHSTDGGATWTALDRGGALAALQGASLAGWRQGQALALLLNAGAPYPQG